MVPSIFCDNLNALGDNQLPPDLHSAWKLHALAYMHVHINSSEAADCHLSFKWSQEFCAPAFSRKPLCAGFETTSGFCEVKDWFFIRNLCLSQAAPDGMGLQLARLLYRM